MTMTIDAKTLFLGFLAAGIAVVTVHEILVLIFKRANWLPEAEPWSTKPMGPWRVPTIFNSIFWGGLWGVVYVLVKAKLPFAAPWQNGWLFGLLMAVISNFTLLPLIKGNPLFMGFNAKLIVAVLLILSGFGMATAVIFAALK